MPGEGVAVSRRVEADKGTASEHGIQDGQSRARDERTTGSGTIPRRPRRSRLRFLLFLLLPLALIGGAYWYVIGGQVMSTDDAYTEADKVGVSTDVSGIVKQVAVTENQLVEAGQILYRLDDLQHIVGISVESSVFFAAVLREIRFPCANIVEKDYSVLVLKRR